MADPGGMAGPSMLALVGEMNGPTLWRALQPVTALEAAGYPCEWGFKDWKTVQKLLDDPRSPHEGYLFARMSWPKPARRMAEAWFERVHDRGKFIVYDADDDVFTIADTYRRIELGWTERKTFDQLEAERAERVWALTQCDGVTVSTEPLAAVVCSFTDRPVIVVPNAIDVRWFRGVVRASVRQIPGLTIGWAGGARSDRDVAAMAVAWGRIAARFPDVRFVVQGYVPAIFLEQVDSSRLSILPWMSLERYPSGLRQVDIACCAVEASRFNASKSPIKAMEAAVAGSVVVATPMLYGSLVEHGVSGYVAETADEWETALSDLIARPALRSMLAKRLLRHVERRCSLQTQLWRWPRAWATIQADARSRRGRLVAV